VYNHQGPEGNYLNAFAPYFSNRYHTLWGDAINFDWEWSDGVRHFYAQNTLYWFEKFHMDGLRFDAIHAIFDFGAVHFWEYLHKQVKELEQSLQRPLHLIAESDLNDPRVIDSPERRGYGFDAQWLDDFHHALYKILYKKDKDRYYDFGSMQQLAKAYTDGFVHSGDEWVKFRKRKYGAPSVGIPGDKFIVFNLNHDQIGNRPDGARLANLVDFERSKIAAAALMLSPYIPMLFMGEEYADDTPFYYFVSHSDPDLVEAVRKGRKEEFKDSGFNTEPPDAQGEETFRASIIQWEKRSEGKHKIQSLPALKNSEKRNLTAEALGEDALILTRNSGNDQLIAFLNFSEKELDYKIPATITNAKKILDSKEKRWMDNAAEGKISGDAIAGGDTFRLQPLSVVAYYTA
jgi:maltooligosyltrehalose trehalohydrolase